MFELGAPSLAQRKISEKAARRRFYRIRHALCRNQLEHNCSGVAVAVAKDAAHGFQEGTVPGLGGTSDEQVLLIAAPIQMSGHDTLKIAIDRGTV